MKTRHLIAVPLAVAAAMAVAPAAQAADREASFPSVSEIVVTKIVVTVDTTP